MRKKGEEKRGKIEISGEKDDSVRQSDREIQEDCRGKLSRVEKNSDRQWQSRGRNVTDRLRESERERDRQRQTEREIDSDRRRDRRAV